MRPNQTCDRQLLASTLSICPSLYPFLSVLSFHPSVCLFYIYSCLFYLSIHLSVCSIIPCGFYLIYLSTCLFYLSIRLSLSVLSFYPFVSPLSFYQSVLYFFMPPSVLSFYPYISLYVLSFYLSVSVGSIFSIFLSVCLSVLSFYPFYRSVSLSVLCSYPSVCVGSISSDPIYLSIHQSVLWFSSCRPTPLCCKVLVLFSVARRGKHKRKIEDICLNLSRLHAHTHTRREKQVGFGPRTSSDLGSLVKLEG